MNKDILNRLETLEQAQRATHGVRVVYALDDAGMYAATANGAPEFDEYDLAHLRNGGMLVVCVRFTRKPAAGSSSDRPVANVARVRGPIHVCTSGFASGTRPDAPNCAFAGFLETK